MPTNDVGTGTNSVTRSVTFEPFESLSLGPEISFIADIRLAPNGHIMKITHGITFTVEMIHQADGGYVAHVPVLPAASTQGKDFREAFEKITENMEGLFADLDNGDLLLEADPEYIGQPRERITIHVRRP